METVYGSAPSRGLQDLGPSVISPWARSGSWPRAFVMSAAYDFDLVCIGSGPAGQRAADTARSRLGRTTGAARSQAGRTTD